MSLLDHYKATFRSTKRLDLDVDLLEGILKRTLAIHGKKAMTKITEDFVRTQLKDINNVKALLKEIEDLRVVSNDKLQGNGEEVTKTTGKAKATTSKKSGKNKDIKRSVDMVSTESKGE